MSKITNVELIERCSNFNCIMIDPCSICPYYEKECALFQSEVNKAPFLTRIVGFGDFKVTADWLESGVGGNNG